MTRINLYWNNICILHRGEIKFLDNIKTKLLEKNIDLNIRFFGLGYSEHMSQYLIKDDAQIPDIIVSADLEVFEDDRIFKKLLNNGLQPLCKHFSTKNSKLVNNLYRNDFLLLYLAIPMIFFVDKNEFSDLSDISLLDLVRKNYPLTFGGISNSAGKTVVKTIWEQGGEKLAQNLLKNSTITNMPIQAFNRVKTGVSKIALVPSIYALSGEDDNKKAICPSDGAIAVPSYICASSTAPEFAVSLVIELLRSEEISEFYIKNGRLISCTPDTRDEPWTAILENRIKIPSNDFIENLSSEYFCEVYNSFFK